jgi:hypothetical protein
MGPYCKYCDQRCFLPRVIPGGPDKGKRVLLATCEAGMAADLERDGYTHETALNPVTRTSAAEALAAEVRGEAAPAGIQRITRRDDLVALKNVLGMHPDWHEPDGRDVTARVFGSDFDNAGNWGTAEALQRKAERARGIPRSGSLELGVTIYRDGKPVAEVNLATLLAWATGYEDD